MMYVLYILCAYACVRVCVCVLKHVCLCLCLRVIVHMFSVNAHGKITTCNSYILARVYCKYHRMHQTIVKHEEALSAGANACSILQNFHVAMHRIDL